MKTEHLDFFKQLLAVYTHTYHEDYMIKFITKHLESKGYDYTVDKVGNIYVTKGETEYYPCVCAHTDTVHRNHREINVNEREVKGRLELFGTFTDDDHEYEMETPTGIGGDDKAGVFVCLRLLEQLPVLKVALFVAEEYGCIGSRNCDREFFKDVGYVIEYDAPEFHMITYHCDGTQLFDENGDFFTKTYPIIKNYFKDKTRLYYHPYTDVSILKRYFDFSCINLSVGYYNLHSDSEYVIVDEVEQAFEMGVEIITKLGNNKYEFISDTATPQEYELAEKYGANLIRNRELFLANTQEVIDN